MSYDVLQCPMMSAFRDAYMIIYPKNAQICNVIFAIFHSIRKFC